MAETRTARMGMPQWSDGAVDAPSRADINEAFLAIEDRALVGYQGLASARPAASSTARMMYFATDTKEASYSDGTTWTSLGKIVSDLIASASSAAAKAAIIKGFASQTADLLDIQESDGDSLHRVTPTAFLDGGVYVPHKSGGGTVAGVPTDSAIGISAHAAASPAVTVKGAASQSADLVRFKNSADSILARVDASGNLIVPKVTVSGGDPASGDDLGRKTYIDAQVATRALASHAHAAADVTSGAFDTARIPNLAASKILAGTLAGFTLTDPVVTYGGYSARGTLVGYANKAALPTTGLTSGQGAMTTDGGSYVWNGSAWVSLSGTVGWTTFTPDMGSGWTASLSKYKIVNGFVTLRLSASKNATFTTDNSGKMTDQNVVGALPSEIAPSEDWLMADGEMDNTSIVWKIFSSTWALEIVHGAPNATFTSGQTARLFGTYPL